MDVSKPRHDRGAGRDVWARLPAQPHRARRAACALGARAREIRHAAARRLAVGGARSARTRARSTLAPKDHRRRLSPTAEDDRSAAGSPRSSRIRRRRQTPRPPRAGRRVRARATSSTLSWLIWVWAAGSVVACSLRRRPAAARLARRVNARRSRRSRDRRSRRGARRHGSACVRCPVLTMPSCDVADGVVPRPAAAAVARRARRGLDRRVRRRPARARARACQTSRSLRRLDRARRRRRLVVEPAVLVRPVGASRAGRARVRRVGHLGACRTAAVRTRNLFSRSPGPRWHGTPSASMAAVSASAPAVVVCSKGDSS